MADPTLEQLHTELIARLDAIDEQLKVIRIHTDGLPVLGEAIENPAPRIRELDGDAAPTALARKRARLMTAISDIADGRLVKRDL
jgi:hypothetical protein